VAPFDVFALLSVISSTNQSRRRSRRSEKLLQITANDVPCHGQVALRQQELNLDNYASPRNGSVANDQAVNEMFREVGHACRLHSRMTGVLCRPLIYDGTCHFVKPFTKTQRAC
jgi:hypothetical protein